VTRSLLELVPVLAVVASPTVTYTQLTATS